MCLSDFDNLTAPPGKAYFLKCPDPETFYVSTYVNNIRNQGKECIKPLPKGLLLEQANLFA